MKRTFLVEIEERSDSTVGIADIGHALTILRTDKCRVTETTAVHAKERELIKATIREEAASDDLSDTPCDALRIAFNWAHDDRRKVARELRALMEGKA